MVLEFERQAQPFGLRLRHSEEIAYNEASMVT